MTENTYEQKLLLDLPPKARDLAVQLFSNTDLGDLLLMMHDPKLDLTRLKESSIPESEWVPILKAATLAKTTYFLPRNQFKQDEVLYLLKIVCLCIDYTITPINFMGVMAYSKDEMPILHDWLEELSTVLAKK